MSCKDFHLDNVSQEGCFAIEQGATLDWLTIFVPDEDLTSWLPEGDIRRDYSYKNGEILASFSFAPLTYSEVISEGNTFFATVIRPTLSAETTLLLPIPRKRTKNDQVIVGRNAWVYDIKLKANDGRTVIIARGLVDVVPDSSRY
ncbi:MAG: hypothetical protein ACRC80_26670 [Waterburya sp.]